jgi:hypothetical protein
MDRHVGKPPSWGLYLHRFHRSDDEAELHNHPWRWAVSLVLQGGYSEERVVGESYSEGKTLPLVMRRQVRPGSLNFLRGDDFHRVDLTDGDAWTLFLVGPVVQSWGFLDRMTGIFTPWRQFLGIPEPTEPGVLTWVCDVCAREEAVQDDDVFEGETEPCVHCNPALGGFVTAEMKRAA